MLNLKELLKEAMMQKASDVHISIGISPKIRVHGKLKTTNFPVMTMADTLEVLLSIVNPEQREIFEEMGEIDISVSIPEVGRYRVNAYKQRSSIALAFRLVDLEIPRLEELKIPKQIIDICYRKHGMVFVTGPSGSGKSTVLATLIDHINSTREAHIITLEDPIEYLHQHKLSIVNQREVGLDTKNYESALKAALREDPDILQIGQMKDPVSMRTAFAAVETGKLVFTSMHTPGVMETLQMIVDLFPLQEQKQARNRLANVLSAIVSRQLCDSKDGGERIPAYEVMLVNNEIKDCIRRGNFEQIQKIMEAKDTENMIKMDDYLTDLVTKGKIDSQTAIQQSKDPEAMVKRLSGGSAN